MKKIPQFLQSLLCQPLLLSQDAQVKLDNFINSILSSDLSPNEEMFVGQYVPKTAQELGYDAKDGIGIINVTGMLIDKYDAELKYWYGDSITSYEELVSDVKTLLDAGAHTIIQYNNSGGGMAYGAFESANKIRNMLDEKEAVMITYSDGVTASAAFALAAPSDVLISNPDSRVGSVGVVVSLLDTSKYMEDLGLKRIFITAGKGKVPLNDKGEFTKDFLDEIQAGVNYTYDKFVKHIVDNRSITKEKLIEVGAKVFYGDEALSVGYVDNLMTRDEFLNYFEGELHKGKTMSFLDKLLNKKMKDETMSDKPEDVQATLEASFEALKQEMVVEFEKARAAYEEKANQEKESLNAEIAELKAALGVKEENEKTLKAQARVAELATFLGDEKAAELSAKFSETDDATFALMVGVLKTQHEAVASKLEVEIGGEGEPVVEEASDEDALTQARAKARASIEKQFKVQKVK